MPPAVGETDTASAPTPRPASCAGRTGGPTFTGSGSDGGNPRDDVGLAQGAGASLWAALSWARLKKQPADGVRQTSRLCRLGIKHAAGVPFCVMTCGPWALTCGCFQAVLPKYPIEAVTLVTSLEYWLCSAPELWVDRRKAPASRRPTGAEVGDVMGRAEPVPPRGTVGGGGVGREARPTAGAMAGVWESGVMPGAQGSARLRERRSCVGRGAGWNGRRVA